MDRPAEDRRRGSLFEESLDRILNEMEQLVSAPGIEKTGEADAEGHFDIAVAADGLSAYVDLYPPSGSGAGIEWLSLVEALDAMGVVGVLTESLVRSAEECNASRRILRRVLVAQGIPPKPPREARLEILFPLNGEGGAPCQEREEAVDFREKGRVWSVAAGDPLAIFEPALPGEEGVDVFGRIIGSPVPAEAVLRPGGGVAVDEDGRTFVATQAGQPVLEKNVLRVDPIYVVEKDVDYGTGNIRFDGSILVRGDVREGFLVEAAYDVEIFGNVEAGEIRVGRDVIVHGGCLGQKASVEAGQDVRVRFVEGGRLSAGRDAEVVSHALHATIRAGGSVLVRGPKGVMGGETEAYDRIDCFAAGSPMGTRTLLAAGSDFRVRAEVAKLDARVRELQANGSKITGAVKSILSRFTGPGKPPIPPDVGGKMERLVRIYTQVMGEITQVQTHRNSLISQMESGMRNRGLVKIKGTVFPGTLIEVRGIRREIVDPLRFCAFRFDPQGGDLAFGSYQ
jgi:uncharacterized protein (DUF342 family)